MYTLVYYVRKTKSNEVFENKYPGEEFRLKRNALHFVREISRECYIESGYAVEDVKDGLNCYRSEKNTRGERETTEMRIRIEKVIK